MENLPPNKPVDNRNWYTKKRFILPLGIIGFFVIIGLSNNSSTPTIQPQVQGSILNQTSTGNLNSTLQIKEITPQPFPVPVKSTQSGLSNNNYYTNAYGNQVHSPAYSNSIPLGASAKCGDGTYSFSQSRRGTCSHHGGAAMWY